MVINKTASRPEMSATILVPTDTKSVWIYDNDDGHSARVSRMSFDKFYGECEFFDFQANSEQELRVKLAKWGFNRVVGVEPRKG
jgi:hypothetical protein